MLNNRFFAHRTIRQYIIAIAKVFSGIKIAKYGDGTNSNEVFTFDIPVMYQGKSKLYATKAMANQMKSGFSNTYPRITFGLNDMVFDSQRQLFKMNQKLGLLDDAAKKSFVPKPYNFNFTLNLFTLSTDSTLTFIEQIVTIFNPEIIIPIKNALGITKDTKIEISDTINFNSDAEYKFTDFSDDVNAISIDFTLQGELYPIITDAKLIEKYIIDIGVGNNLDDDDELVIVDTMTIPNQ